MFVSRVRSVFIRIDTIKGRVKQINLRLEEPRESVKQHFTSRGFVPLVD